MAEMMKGGGSATTAGGGGAAIVKSIFIYPIKSCRGISVSQAPLSSTGFKWDRQWVVVNSKGRAYTQRVEPKLALIQVEMPKEAFSEGWQPNKSSYLVVRAPGMSELKVPLTKPSVSSDGVSVWEWSGSALDEGDDAAKWFTDYIGKPSRLVRFNEETQARPVDPDYAPGFNIMFSDLFQYLLISQASLDAVNAELKEPVSINRFRPNIFVDGCEPFAEDLWKEIKINDVVFQGVMLCARCKVPTINQETAAQGSEPTETMMSFRSDKALSVKKPKFKGRVYIGQMLVWKDCVTGGQRKMVRVGDLIQVDKVCPSYADVPA